MRTLWNVLFFALLLSSCAEAPKDTIAEAIAQEILAKVPDSWILERVAAAQKKLEASEAGVIVWQAMEAHGGLKQWYSNGPIAFQFNYQPLDDGVQRNTTQIIDTWSSRARHRKAVNPKSEYGWDGKQAWLLADSTTFPYNTRFWSLTPYFFLGQPFVLDGDGVNLEKLEQKMFRDTTYDVVKVTFDEGTGDAPDDYYVLYFNADSHQLKVIRYIVSYPGYFPKGKHLPEKFMELQGKQIVEDILLPKGYKTHWLTETEEAGEYITKIDVSNVEFLPELEAAYFDVPAGAKILEGL